MTLIYADGKRLEAILLKRTGNNMRVAAPGKDDVMELVNFHGVWVTEECEPVDIEFEWQKCQTPGTESENSRQLASRLAWALLSAAGQSQSQLPS